MPGSIPLLSFRIEPGYTLDQNLFLPEIDANNFLVGGLPAGREQQALMIGKIAEYQKSKIVWLDYEGAHAIYVMGKRRSGKTFTLGVLLEGLASDEWIRQGTEKQAVVMVDTMNVFITMSHATEDVHGATAHEVAELERWRLKKEAFDVVLFYPKGTVAPPEGVSREMSLRPSDLSAEDWAALFGFDTYRDPMGQLLADVYERVVEEGYDDSLGNHVEANDGYLIPDLIRCLDTCPAVVASYQPDTIRALRARLNAIRRLPVFSDTGIELSDVFRPGQISVLLLRDLEQSLRSLLVGTLVKKVSERRSVADKFERLASVQRLKLQKATDEGRPDRAESAQKLLDEYTSSAQQGLPRGWIIIDEAHNYIPANGITPSAGPLKKYVNEGRNLGLSIVVATQNPSALDPAIRRNADVLIIHSISMRDDIATAEGMVNTFIPDSFEFGREKVSSRTFEQLVRSLPLGYAVISNDRASRVFVAKIRPRITIHGGVEY